MDNKRIKKNALLSSVLALSLSVIMLIGTTFAWFTDTATTAVNKIQAGTLDVALEMEVDQDEWVSAEDITLEFIKAEEAPQDEPVLWEPGCTYKLPKLRVVNNGSLAVKFKVIITGIMGDAKLNEVIDWNISLPNFGDAEYQLLPGDNQEFEIEGHMQETAGNEYQGLSIDGISISVIATQDTVEYDSNSNSYDEDALFPAASADIAAGGNIVLFDDLTTDKDFAPDEDTVLDLNGKTLTATKGLKVVNGDLTMNNGTLKKTGSFGYIDIRPDGAPDGQKIRFENVDFINEDPATFNNAVDEMVKLVLDKPGDIEFEFINCKFENAIVVLSGINDSNGTVKAAFTNCEFNSYGTIYGAIDADAINKVNINLELNNCTFNMESTGNFFYVIRTRTNGTGTINITGDGNKLNAKQAAGFGEAAVRLIGFDDADYSGLDPVIVTKDPLDGFTVEKAWGVPFE
ncbi:MAG TPA: hypothetical protein GX017_05835 [Clostridiales bacterium]|nr:hypothetical protein [Clostridiales bacterium]